MPQRYDRSLVSLLRFERTPAPEDQMARTIGSHEPKNYEAIVALRGAYEQRLATILAEGVSEGEFEIVDIQVATFAILALLTGICTWYRPGGRLTKEAIVAAHEKLVLSSVAAGPA